jgi:hypothetical protein
MRIQLNKEEGYGYALYNIFIGRKKKELKLVPWYQIFKRRDLCAQIEELEKMDIIWRFHDMPELAEFIYDIEVVPVKGGN